MPVKLVQTSIIVAGKPKIDVQKASGYGEDTHDVIIDGEVKAIHIVHDGEPYVTIRVSPDGSLLITGLQTGFVTLCRDSIPLTPTRPRSYICPKCNKEFHHNNGGDPGDCPKCQFE